MANHFVTEAFIKTTVSFVNGNVDALLISSAVPLAEELFAENILGTYFYNELLGKYTGQTLSTDERALVAKLKPAIAWRAAAISLNESEVQFQNKGPQSQFGDNSSDPVENKSNSKFRRWNGYASAYEQKVVKHLQVNELLFSAYTCAANFIYMAPDAEDAWDNDVFIV